MFPPLLRCPLAPQSLVLGALVVRWVHYISFQPRLSIIAGTLVLALPDLVHFAIVVAICIIMFAAAACIVLGQLTGQLRDMASSISFMMQYALLRNDGGLFGVRTASGGGVCAWRTRAYRGKAASVNRPIDFMSTGEVRVVPFCQVAQVV